MRWITSRGEGRQAQPGRASPEVSLMNVSLEGDEGRGRLRGECWRGEGGGEVEGSVGAREGVRLRGVSEGSVGDGGVGLRGGCQKGV